MRLEQQAWLTDPATQTLLRAFSDAGEDIRFVGGAVRDAIMQRPVKDIDACTPAPPDRVMELLKASHIKVVPTGIAHGTVTAVIDHKPFEITTLRTDTACDGRHATVAFTDDWQADAARRDFTLNALYCDAQGTITDFFGGIADARAGRIIFIGDAMQRIEEDALRILRFFRFFATHGAAPADTAALAACSAMRGAIGNLSGERIQHEMFKLLATENPYPSLQLMQETGVLEEIIAGVAVVVLSTDKRRNNTHLVRLALLLRTAENPGQAVAAIASRWKCSNRDRTALKTLTVVPTLPVPTDETALIGLMRCYGRDTAGLLLLRDQWETGHDLDTWIKQTETVTIPEFPVNGGDLQRTGITPGPQLGETLKRLESAWEESGYRLGKAELLALL